MTDPTTAPPPADPYAAPTLDCDIVMKGGITSGVVYPLAVGELARDYRFRSIGGTSAGAIAAAVAGAAEHRRRRTGDGGGFAELERLPKWLGADSPCVRGSNLFGLFQPQRETRPVFEVLAAGMRTEGGGARGALRAALVSFAGSALAGAAPGLALAAAAFAWSSGWPRAAFLLGALLLAVAGVAAGLGYGLFQSLTGELPRQGFGLCSGAPGAGCDGAPALTPWLAELIDELAGKAGSADPLTFGDLWATADPHAPHEVELQFVTTNVTHGRPHRLPYDTTHLFFDPAELRRYFPERVVDWMVRHAGTTSHAPETPGRILPLPEPADLPVIVGARMSLSFPFLISAVPLYAIDFTRADPKDHVPERCWFSDGGLCSNFPVHFFDHTLPQWPTFDLNLREFHRDHPRDPADESHNSWVVPDNRSGLGEQWARFDSGSGARRIGAFAAALVLTAKDWHDNVQLRVPGYKDRVVHVFLDPDEGGLNLQMPEELITRLGERGRLAAVKLAKRFSPAGDGSPMTWDNHRWVRFRSGMALLENELRELRAVLGTPGGGGSYDALIRAARHPSYEWDAAHQRECIAWLDRILADPYLARDKPSFGDSPPKPRPVLRIVPRF
jgi:predicted acylesterase/phospholipase RssA